MAPKLNLSKYSLQIRNIIGTSFLLLLFNCCKNKKQDHRFLISENYFTVSAFEKKVDSLNSQYKNSDFLEVPADRYHNRLNKNFLNGAFHFLILDNDHSYYAVDSSKLSPLLCGAQSAFSKQDSLNFIKESNILTEKMHPIKTAEIIEILKQNQNIIIDKNNMRPCNISFALRNDTLDGTAMYDIINFMENNDMKLYTIRRMNEYEVRKTE